MNTNSTTTESLLLLRLSSKMVSISHLHYDVLRIIFSHLTPNDLFSASLVSKSFKQAATPKLYHTITCTYSIAKRHPATKSPFHVLLAQPSLSVHVRACDISALPMYKNNPDQAFLADSIRALDLCTNLSRFRLAPNVLPSFLKLLSSKQNKLQELHVNGSLTMEQCLMLKNLTKLKVLRLDHASWCLMHILPEWAIMLGATLISLTITLSTELNDQILKGALRFLPNLRHLHIRNCMRIEHHAIFRMLRNFPLLESLSVTIWENPTTDTTSYAPLPSLRSLHLSSKSHIIPTSTPPLYTSLLTHLTHSPLTSLTLQLTDPYTLPAPVITTLLSAPFARATLKTLKLVRVHVGVQDLKRVCMTCKELAFLELAIPSTGLLITGFTNALSHAHKLHTLEDNSDGHTQHGPHHPSNNNSISGNSVLRHDDIKHFMMEVPNLRTVICENRIWRGTGSKENLRITLERRKANGLPKLVEFEH